MRSRHTLAVAGLAVVVPAVLVQPEPTLAVFNDVVTIEVGVAAWRPDGDATSTAGQPSGAPAADDPFAPLVVPPTAGGAPDDGVLPSPEPQTATADQETGSVPGVPETDGSTAEPVDDATGPEPAVVPEVDTTVSPAEAVAPAAGTEGADAGDGVSPTSPAPTSDG